MEDCGLYIQQSIIVIKKLAVASCLLAGDYMKFFYSILGCEGQ